MIDPWNCYIKPEYTQHINIDSVRTIFEIGSRECGYTQDIINCYTKCEELHCFECNPYATAICTENVNKIIKANSIKKVKFNNVGISSVKEKLKFYPVLVGDDYGSSSAGFYPTEKAHSLLNTNIEIDCTTIDDYCIENNISQIDLLLIDIEGGELKAFQGAKTMLSTVSYIITETQDVQRNSNSPLRSEIIDFLSQFGFKEAYTTCNGYFGDSIFVK